MLFRKSVLAIAVLITLFIAPSFFGQDSAQVSQQKAKEIIEKYLDAIGGRDALSKIDDRTTIMRGTAMGQTLTIIVKQKTPNKMRQELKAGGMDQLTIFDGENGMMKVMDQNIEVKDKELESLKIEASMEFLLNPENYGIKLSYEGSDKVNDKEVEKVKMILPSGLRWWSFFDLESGLKLKEQKEMQTQMGLIEQSLVFEEYKNVDGIMYPHKITQSFGPQSIEVTVSSIKVNKGLADDIFVISE